MFGFSLAALLVDFFGFHFFANIRPVSGSDAVGEIAANSICFFDGTKVRDALCDCGFDAAMVTDNAVVEGVGKDDFHNA
jgi:hypothetical protein